MNWAFTVEMRTRFRERHPSRILNGWELKPYAIIHSEFEEVLYLDADNLAVVNPAFLFENERYHELGAIFWPDYGCLIPERAIWRICDIPYRYEPELETGQMVIHKRLSWEPLQLAMHMNEHSDFYYQHINGDKETFHFAWHILGQSYAIPPFHVQVLGHTFLQHDFRGSVLFQHRIGDKWKVGGDHTLTPGIMHEEVCLKYLRELKDKL